MILDQHTMLAHSAKEAGTEVARIAMLGIELLAFLLRSLPENPTKQDVTRCVTDVAPQETQPLLIDLLSDRESRTRLKELLAA